jgi:hypothetical protein
MTKETKFQMMPEISQNCFCASNGSYAADTVTITGGVARWPLRTRGKDGFLPC